MPGDRVAPIAIAVEVDVVVRRLGRRLDLFAYTLQQRRPRLRLLFTATGRLAWNQDPLAVHDPRVGAPERIGIQLADECLAGRRVEELRHIGHVAVIADDGRRLRGGGEERELANGVHNQTGLEHMFAARLG